MIVEGDLGNSQNVSDRATVAHAITTPAVEAHSLTHIILYAIIK
jgi:hypothetical protein